MNDIKSHGSDNFSCFFLNKKAASSFELPQSLLFQCSLNESKLPDIRKTACIVPLYKGKATHNEIVNYRPLSLISIVCKIMESVIKNKLMRHCIDNNLISNIQHGFINGNSTLLQIY